MSTSGILKSSLVKKYWMALTGLFLCLFLVGHLAGNLQLFIPGYAGKIAFNEYAVFMTTNPAVKLLSYLTYASILFHAIDGIVLTRQNRAARSTKYAYEKASANSNWSSRNMAFLGIITLAYIIFHMSDFWFEYKFGEMPYMMNEAGTAVMTSSSEAIVGGTVVDGYVFDKYGENRGLVMKDLHEEVVEAFQVWWIVLAYVVGMVALAFHLWHGVHSAFQSIGLNHEHYTPKIKKFGAAFAVGVPVLFGLIPVYLYFV